MPECVSLCLCVRVNEKRKLKVQQDWQHRARPRSPASTMTAAAAASTSTASTKKYATLFAAAAPAASAAAVALPAAPLAATAAPLFSLLLLLPLPLRELQAEIKCDLFAWLWTARENNEKVVAYQCREEQEWGNTDGHTHTFAKCCSDTPFAVATTEPLHCPLPCSLPFLLPPISQLFHLLHLAPSACLAHCWLCLRVVMRSKLYLPSIVHDVKRAVGVAVGQVMPPHTGCNANLAFGGRFDFFIGFDECVAKKKLVFRVIKCFHLANMQLQRIYCIGSELIKAPNWPLTHAVPLARNVKLKSNAVKYANCWWPPFDWGAKQLLKGQSM